MDDNCLSCKSTYLGGNLKKRLIVCCDGTASAVDKGTKEFVSNVGRLSRSIARVGVTPEGEKVPQIVYYQAGVGSGQSLPIQKAKEGAFGAGLAENVCEAYHFLATNWAPGDEIFIFGFSRGAYTARALAGFICEIGLLTPLMLDSFYELYLAFKERGKKHFSETKWANEPLAPGELGTLPPRRGDTTKPNNGTRIEYMRKVVHMHVKIKVVGVWDTVGSLTATNWWGGEAGEDLTFHTTKLSSKIENAFHALAIDETRGNFPPTLWYLGPSCYDADEKPKVNLKQVWFPGYHSDVGGHSISSIDTNSVDEIALSWMIDQLHDLLQLSTAAVAKYILYRIGDANLDTSNPKIRDLDAAWRSISWSNGTLEDNNKWMDGWWVASVVSKGSMSYKRVPGETKAYEGDKLVDYRHFNEEIHPSVHHRMVERKDQKYVPVPFGKGSGWSYIAPSNGSRGRWVKVTKDKDGKDKTIVLNEYLIANPKSSATSSGYAHWQGSLERTFAPKDVLAAQDAVNAK